MWDWVGKMEMLRMIESGKEDEEKRKEREKQLNLYLSRLSKQDKPDRDK